MSKGNPMLTVDLLELIERNAAEPGRLGVVWDRRGPDYGVPPDHLTLVCWRDGDPLWKGRPVRLARNVAFPVVPEKTVYAPWTLEGTNEPHPDAPVQKRGWRELLRVLLADRTILPTDEIKELLHDFSRFPQARLSHREAWACPLRGR